MQTTVGDLNNHLFTDKPNSIYATPNKYSENGEETILGFIPDLNEIFTLESKIGEGTFSCVYLAKLKEATLQDERVALKYLVPTCHPFRVESEIKCLQIFGGTNNVIGLKFSFRFKDHVILAMPYFPHDKFVDYVGSMTVDEIRAYMKNLFVALHHVHLHGVIHRDVKPSNFLYDRKGQRFALVDFGLSQKADASRTRTKSASSAAAMITKSGSENCFIPRIRSIPVTNGPSKRKIEDLSPNKSVTASPDKKRIALGNLSSNDLNTQRNSLVQPPVTHILFQSPSAPVTLSASLPGFTRLVPPPCGIANTSRNMKISSLVRPLTRTLPMNSALKSTKDLQSVKTSISQATMPSCTCNCIDKWQVCKLCVNRGNQVAARAGTPGFRSPEVLLKHPRQTTAVDMWSAGVIFLCLLSGRYPFFNAPDDITALAEIVTLFGDKAVKRIAGEMGKLLTSAPPRPPLDLRKVCLQLRGISGFIAKGATVENPVTCRVCHQTTISGECVCEKMPSRQQTTPVDTPLINLPNSAFELLSRLLTLDPESRISAKDALSHPFIASDTCY